MEKKYNSIFILVIFVLAVAAGYYWYNSNSHDNYYNSYKMQLNSTNKSMELCESALGSIMLSMMGQDISKTNITADLNGANSSTKTAISYSQEMLKYSSTDSEKEYAETLIKQSNEMEKFIELSNNLLTSTGNTGKFNDIMKQLNTVKTQEESYQNDLYQIRTKDPDLSNHLDQIEKSLN
jgi:hypothetical protein